MGRRFIEETSSQLEGSSSSDHVGLLTEVRVRSVGLLSRLATHPNAIVQLRDRAFLRALTGSIQRNHAASAGKPAGGTDKAVLEERQYLIQILATLVSTITSPASSSSTATSSSMPPEWIVDELIAGSSSSSSSSAVLPMLVHFLPPPTTNGISEVTPESVVIAPHKEHHVSPNLSGNVVKVIIAVIERGAEGPGARQLYDAGFLERSVSLLANEKDLSVRKNTAVAMAKAMRCASANTRVRSLRGMEMLLHLGPQLT
uniref:Uncharacterized protein n=2 Tax=Octactis speculum TaxID=3111310 RepID=A0A7S2E3F9_9STRA|mmetsp:Transcript_58098/g.79185  ORF Transcript_58098/g.79185 Transcript_58098/m.79185 type:complete len:258 (+) Transcript_58098:24-797(+)